VLPLLLPLPVLEMDPAKLLRLDAWICETDCISGVDNRLLLDAVPPVPVPVVLFETGEVGERRPDPDWWILLLPVRPFRRIERCREAVKVKAGDGALITGTDDM